MGNCIFACFCSKLEDEEEHLRKCDCVKVDVVSVDESTDSSMPDLRDPSSDSSDEEQEGETGL